MQRTLKNSDRSAGSSPSNFRRKAMSKTVFQSQKDPSAQQDEHDVLHIEDYDANIDNIFINEHLTPYFKDLFKDLMMRSSNPNHLDKVTFIEYTKLPGIINDRLHFMFSSFKDGAGKSPSSSPK